MKAYKLLFLSLLSFELCASEWSLIVVNNETKAQTKQVLTKKEVALDLTSQGGLRCALSEVKEIITKKQDNILERVLTCQGPNSSEAPSTLTIQCDDYNYDYGLGSNEHFYTDSPCSNEIRIKDYTLRIEYWWL